MIDKAKIIAAHLMEAADADVVFADGKFTVAGTDSEKGFGDIALAAYVPHNYPHDRLEPGLEETAFYDPLNFTYPSGTHMPKSKSTRQPALSSLSTGPAVTISGT